MKNIITKFLFCVIFLCLNVGSNFAQTFCLQLIEISNDGINSTVSVQVQGDVSFTLGSSNFQFAYTDGAFGAPSLVSSPLAPPFYFVPTITQPFPNAISLNIELAFTDDSGLISANPGFTEIAVINLPISDPIAAADGATWDYNGGTTQTVVFIDDEATQIFASAPTCLIGYTPDIVGCTDNTACNYDPDALVNDNSCINIGDPCDDNDTNTIDDVITVDCLCEGSAIVSGCTDANACNFNADANLDDGSCLIIGESCDDNDANTTEDVITVDCICLGVQIVLGCTDTEACNFNVDANMDDGSCINIGDDCDDNDPDTEGDTINDDCICEGTVGIDDLSGNESELIIYPNPAQNDLFLNFQLKEAGLITFEIFDVLGNQVKSAVSALNSGDVTHSLNTESLKAGMYILRISNGENNASQKFSIIR